MDSIGGDHKDLGTNGIFTLSFFTNLVVTELVTGSARRTIYGDYHDAETNRPEDRKG